MKVFIVLYEEAKLSHTNRMSGQIPISPFIASQFGVK